ncbi:MAG TPA: cyclic nucleotide-binding domain-containing protein [Devosiaceae bacterium]|nr:cyclic nucleotide-binding domain-containing protein [Devosiaceae bacterium]
MQTIRFPAGETILAEGEFGDRAYLLVSGSVEVILGSGARAKRIATLGAGEVFGEMSLLEPGPRSATVRTISEVECVATSYEDFTASIQENPEQAILFMKTLVRRLRQTNEMVGALDPGKRGLRGLIADWQKSLLPSGGAGDEEAGTAYAVPPYLLL